LICLWVGGNLISTISCDGKFNFDHWSSFSHVFDQDLAQKSFKLRAIWPPNLQSQTNGFMTRHNSSTEVTNQTFSPILQDTKTEQSQHDLSVIVD
jgi:hypothetical protein